MITLRLFRADNPFNQIDARTLQSGELTIGRETSADWTWVDAGGELSRRHCVIGRDGESLWVRDTSTNGVLIGTDKRRAPRDVRLDISPGETLFMGAYMLMCDPDARDDDGGDRQGRLRDASMQPSTTNGTSGPVGSPAEHVGLQTDAALLEAFCRGARLEHSSFAGEDPAEVMVRLGVIYRQVVDDLCALMSDRASLKETLQLDRTTISASDNNPLKWAPPERVAADVLRDGPGGFLKGAAAFKASFSDIRQHGVCLVAGARAATQSILVELDPDRLEAMVKRQPLAFQSRSDAAWQKLKDRHAALKSETAGQGGGTDRAFREGYEAQFRALEARLDAT